jgi:hypothetical protein
MALDPRIALGVQPVQIQSPFELAGQVSALRDAQQRNKLVEMQMRESQRALEEQNALRRVVSAPGFFDRPDALETVVGQFGETGAKLVEAIGKGRKAQTDAEQTELKNRIENSQALYDILGTAEDDDSWKGVYDQAKSAGLDMTNVPTTFNRLWSANARRQAQGYGKYLENQLEARKVGVSEGTLQQSKDRLAFERDQDQWKRNNPEYDLKETALGFVAVNKRNPSDVRMVTGGDGKPLMGAVAQKATEDQLKTAYNANRMLSAGDVIGKALKVNPNAEKPGFWETVVGNTPFISGAVNFTRDDERQQIAAAQIQLADALLYLATGAAYNKLQYDNNQEAIIPQFSDGAGTIKAKRKLFLDQVEAAKNRSASAWTDEHEKIYKDMLQMYDTPLAPPPGAIKDLLADPSAEAIKEFDEAFGEGAATKLLKPKK